MLDTASLELDKSGSGRVLTSHRFSGSLRSKGATQVSSIQLVPAYGRDYKTQAEVQEAWNANKDFWTADIIHGYGVATNKEDCDSMGLRVVIRYANKQKLYAVK